MRTHVIAAVLTLASTASAQPKPPAPATPTYPSETPATFTPTRDGYDFERRTVDIPVRDGVKLHTVILIPRGAKRAPILLTRTPYHAEERALKLDSVHLRAALGPNDFLVQIPDGGGYIRVFQDVRGKYGSEGDYVMSRPVRGPQNPSPVDHATDAYDTIEWLVKNVPESNGKVGLIGNSYDGFTALMGLVDPHPALAAVVPTCPMVDGWRGDDWFHNGAFRQLTMTYFYGQEATRGGDASWPTPAYDLYDWWLEAGSAGEVARRMGLEQVGFWTKVAAHPAYDAFWSDQAVDRVLAARPLTVPTLLVHGLWDQEDIYGALAVYRALAPKDPRHEKLFLALGPWNHGGYRASTNKLGPIPLDGTPGVAFQRDVLLPFLDRHLKDGAPKATIPPVSAFQTGVNRWQKLDVWPSGCARGCAPRATPLYLAAGGKASFTAPAAAGYDEYVADPARPVPFVPRPVIDEAYPGGDELWRTWLVSDQRGPASRPDVLVYATEPLAEPLAIAGEPLVNLVASTTGTDADWVVKVIDVYPAEVPEHVELGGYQLAVSMDIFRGRYRESLSTPRAIAAGAVLPYRFALPAANHVFLPGHRIMVQVQSSWFPLYDRNPQTFVPNIMFAKPADFQKATQRVHRSPGQASFVELPVVKVR